MKPLQEDLVERAEFSVAPPFYTWAPHSSLEEHLSTSCGHTWLAVSAAHLTSDFTDQEFLFEDQWVTFRQVGVMGEDVKPKIGVSGGTGDWI